MATLFTGIGALLGIGKGAAAAAGVAGAATTATTVASSGISLASILQGVATVAGVVASISAANAEAETQELAADDADREQAIETVQGIERRSSIKRALVDAIGAQDVAYAASGLDLTFGTAAQARKDAYREADLGLTSATGTEQISSSRLMERAANYRTAAKRTRTLGLFKGLSQGIGGFSSLIRRGA
ncbi:hypothetical protein [Mesorhizobium sp. Z1-4]|uniref:hypothetical protein n=1 Tax=Mesorhizobium sp. Z1-4 TaxID=2448478 RepID=UPI000FD8E78D|nr:hypothetical protein [Mesorhizobium sp. Z1-4]